MTAGWALGMCQISLHPVHSHLRTATSEKKVRFPRKPTRKWGACNSRVHTPLQRGVIWKQGRLGPLVRMVHGLGCWVWCAQHLRQLPLHLAGRYSVSLRLVLHHVPTAV